jgi:hypothetical protein
MVEKSHSSGHLLERISANFLSSQIPEVEMPVAANKNHPKTKKEDLENEMSIGRIESFWYILRTQRAISMCRVVCVPKKYYIWP